MVCSIKIAALHVLLHGMLSFWTPGPTPCRLHKPQRLVLIGREEQEEEEENTQPSIPMTTRARDGKLAENQYTPIHPLPPVRELQHWEHLSPCPITRTSAPLRDLSG